MELRNNYMLFFLQVCDKKVRHVYVLECILILNKCTFWFYTTFISVLSSRIYAGHPLEYPSQETPHVSRVEAAKLEIEYVLYTCTDICSCNRSKHTYLYIILYVRSPYQIDSEAKGSFCHSHAYSIILDCTLRFWAYRGE